MLGVVASHPVSPGELLRSGPRCLRELSREHADGWGIAVHHDGAWTIHRDTSSAVRSARFAEVAASEGSIIIAHVRKKTVGPTSLVNTHPFCRGRFVFAHNGTVANLAAITARTAPEYLDVAGETDSEKLFGFILTRIDEAGDVSLGVTRAVQALHAIDNVGSTNFLLSCGQRMYAHRLGRSLYVLRRSDVVAVASEPVTDEVWQELGERELVTLEAPAPAQTRICVNTRNRNSSKYPGPPSGLN